MTHLLGSGDDVSHSGLLATNVIIESLVFLELYSDDVGLCARGFCLSQLCFHFSEPVQELVNVTDHFQRSLPKQQTTMRKSWHCWLRLSSRPDNVAFVKTHSQRNRLVFQVSFNTINKHKNLRKYWVSQRFCFCQLNILLTLSRIVIFCHSIAWTTVHYLFGEVYSLSLALDLLSDCVKASIVSCHQSLYGGGTLSRRYLTQLRANQVDAFQDGSELCK